MARKPNPDSGWAQEPAGEHAIPAETKKGSGAKGCLLGLVLVVVIGFVAIVVTNQPKDDKAASSSACRHFRNIAGDAMDGILTDVELREKLKEVDASAVGGTPEVRSAARAMLAGVTQGDLASAKAAVKDMDAACKAAGF